MGTQRISGGGGGGCHGGAGGGGGGGTQDQKAHALAHQGSFYNLTLDEVQHHLGDLGKPISSMNLDELLKTVSSAGANQGLDNAVFMAAREGELGNHLRQKTVDEVWQDIQQGQSKCDSHSISRSQERQTTLGEMTLEDFLVKAGVVAEAPPGGRKTPGPILGEDQTTLSQGQAQWVPYELPSILRHPQQQQQNMMSVYMPGHQVAHQSLPVADAAYPETTMAISPAASLMGPPSDTMTAARKRSAPGGVLERTVERRHKRMIKNRESVARSRARKQAYTNELENKVSRLEEENERLRRKKSLNFDMNSVFISSVTKLLYLETIFLHTSRTTNMPDDIWNMVKLRHLYNKYGKFHFKASPSQGAKRSSVLPNLQTLHTLCACKSCLTNLVRIPNLKKLGLKGSLISECGCSTIPDLGFLEQLLTLKVTNTNQSFNSWTIPDQSSALFKLKLPASLRKLTLQYTFLKWEEISVLAELENLEVLKLLDDACVDTKGGSGWDTSDLEFPKLKYLMLDDVFIKKWDDSDLQFDNLEVLALVRCWGLESIPFDLALSPSLHTIEVTRCKTSLEMLAKEIAAEHESICGNSDLKVFIKSA